MEAQFLPKINHKENNFFKLKILLIETFQQIKYKLSMTTTTYCNTHCYYDKHQ